MSAADPLPDPSTRRRSYSFADLVAAEEAQVKAGTADGCADTCLCHGGHVCVRIAHPHDPASDVVPHVGRMPDGQLIQWVCTDPEQRALTADDHAAISLRARVEHTRALLDGIDRDVLRAFLDGDGGNLPKPAQPAHPVQVTGQ
jgi:hypothetical protein